MAPLVSQTNHMSAFGQKRTCAWTTKWRGVRPTNMVSEGQVLDLVEA